MQKKIIFIIIFFILSFSGVIFAWQSASYNIEIIKDENQVETVSENSKAVITTEKKETEKKLKIEKHIDRLVEIGDLFWGLKKSETLFLLKVAILEQNQPIIIKVPEEFESIQIAIENAKKGDIIEVAPGEYHENITMEEGVSLRGADTINLIPLSSLVAECLSEEIIEVSTTEAVIKTTTEEEIIDSPLENLEIEDCDEQENINEEIILQDENLTDDILLPEENFDVVINGNGVGNVITFKNGITNKTTLSGFIIKNSGKNLSGILIEDSSPWIHDNILIDNEFNIYIKGDSAPVIQKNSLKFASKGIQVYNFQKEEELSGENEQEGSTQENGANNKESGANAEEGEDNETFSTKPNIIDNLITDNKIGIDLYNSSALINHNTISYNNHYQNYLGATYGIYAINSSAEIINNIISDNGVCDLCAGINIDEKSTDISVGYNNIWNNRSNFVCYGQCEVEDTNLSESPLFANSINGNYFLKNASGLIGKAEDRLDIGVRW